ncbi:translocation/assembly module TamB [Candidatus Dependentiae bacterium]|nr:translocation/assembly module TamB [Candidatus Dependentiae bacterium]
MKKRFAKLLLGLSLGIIPALWIIQNNKHVKQFALKSIIKHLEEKWNAHITVKRVHVNFFTGIIHLDQLTIKSKAIADCIWTCKHCALHVMQQRSLYDKKISLHVALTGNKIVTEYRNKTIGLTELIRAIFLFQSNRFNAQSFLINSVNVSIKNNPDGPNLSYNGSLFFKKDTSNLWHGRIISKNSSFSLDNKPIFTSISGLTQFHQLPTPLQALQTKLAYTFRAPSLHGNEPYSLAGTWGDQKTIKLKNESETTVLSIAPTQDGFSIMFDISRSQQIKLSGKILANLTSPTITGSYQTALSFGSRGTPICGTFCLSSSQLISSGSTGYADYFVACDLQKSFPLTRILLRKNNKTVALLKQKKNSRVLTGSISYRFIQSFLPIKLRQCLLGNRGAVNLEISFEDLNRPTGTISLVDGKIHVPGNYNLITNVSAKFSCHVQSKKLILSNINVGFHKGLIICDRATLCWNNSYEPTFIHAHAQATDLLLNWKDNVFAFINGNFLVTKPYIDKPTHIFGDVIIKKSLLKESLFSEETTSHEAQSSILPIGQNKQPIFFDLSILSEQELSIKTQYLQTRATSDLHVTFQTLPEGITTPQISGNIALRQGTLTFPKHTLFISSGRIDFIPTQINNPMVNLLAKNRIKKYLVSLHVAGPLQQPTIFLESNPELTEEQILALLFAGSETISLQANLPVILMQNLQKLIFGNKQELPPAQQFFKKITSPLKYIQVAPNFTDQSGRGGVKGTISIDINKRLHGLIQKNFTLQDDLAFQIEYFLSDDFNIKATKDAREDIGVELELVYKK